MNGNGMFVSTDGVTESTNVYDQSCRNCRWWYTDLDYDTDVDESNNKKCHRRGSEKNGHRTSPSSWCWAWQQSFQNQRNQRGGAWV